MVLIGISEHHRFWWWYVVISVKEAFFRFKVIAVSNLNFLWLVSCVRSRFRSRILGSGVGRGFSVGSSGSLHILLYSFPSSSVVCLGFSLYLGCSSLSKILR